MYCTLDEVHHYTKLPTKYRGYDYYAKFTDAQYEATAKLIRFLCAKYNLPKTFLPESKRFNVLTSNEFTTFSGIATHVNCRTDKVDIGPAFDWSKLINRI